MEKLRVYHNRKENTMSIWFDDPEKAAARQEAAADVVLVKDKKGRVIGFERLNFLAEKQRKEGIGVPVEVHVV